MKSSLISMLILLISIFILLILFVGGYALYLVSGFSAVSLEVSTEEFWGFVLSGVPLLFPAVLALALFITFLRLRTKPGIRPVTFFLIFALSLGAFWGSQLFIDGDRAEGLTGAGSYYFEPGKIYRFPGNEKVYIHEENQSGPGGGLAGQDGRAGQDEPVSQDGRVSLIAPKTEDGKTILEYYPNGSVHGQILTIQGPGGGKREISLREKAEPGGSPLLHITGFSREGRRPSQFFNNFTRLGHELFMMKRQGNLFVYLISMAAATFYMTAAWGFIRATRWPLFNTIIVFFLLCGAGGLYGIFTDPVMRPLAAMVSGFGRGLPLWVLASILAGLILLLADLLFIPYKKRIAEETDE